MITEERKREIRELTIEYRDILDYDYDLPEKQIGELLDLLLELTSPEAPTVVAESQGKMWEEVYDEFGILNTETLERLQSKFILTRRKPLAGEDEKGDLE